MLSMRMVDRPLDGRANLLGQTPHRARHAGDVAARQIERHPLAAQRANPANIAGHLVDGAFERAAAAALGLVGERQHVSRREADRAAGLGGQVAAPRNSSFDGGEAQARGCQTSPSNATRRSAGEEIAPGSPPTQIGGCGVWAGRGAKGAPEKFRHLPAKERWSALHAALITRRYSSVWAPRSRKGSPRLRNSSSSQPTPTPKMN